MVFRIRWFHRLSGICVVRAFMPATGAKPKSAKINLMGCSCPCSEVEICKECVTFSYESIKVK